MVTKESRNRLIKELREKVPELTLEQIGKAFDGLSRQRVYQIVQLSQEHDIIIDKMENKEVKINKPMSATEVSKAFDIPYGAISMWVSRGLVKPVVKPEHRGSKGNPVLLDPVALQERIELYKAKRQKAKV